MKAQRLGIFVSAYLLAWVFSTGSLWAFNPPRAEALKPCEAEGVEGKNAQSAESGEGSSSEETPCESASDAEIEAARPLAPDHAPRPSQISGTPRPGAARTQDEKKADLQRKLDDSLAEFDELLWWEQQRLADRQAAADSSGGEDGASGGGESGDGGPSGGGSARELEGEGTDAEGPQDQVAEGGQGVLAETPAAAGAAMSGDARDEVASGRIPPDIPDGHDDDIVARQLREAAMSEDDPVLREKLWQEYRKYRGDLE